VGFNPYRKKVVRPGDVALLIIGIAVALALLGWALFA
jgi:hypothetical protein